MDRGHLYSISQALGITCTATPVVDFKTYLTALSNGEMKGMWRLGWQMDYPSIENFLAPLYAKGADSNYYGPYDNPEFVKKLAEAAAADYLDEAYTLTQEAESIIAQEWCPSRCTTARLSSGGPRRSTRSRSTLSACRTTRPSRSSNDRPRHLSHLMMIGLPGPTRQADHHVRAAAPGDFAASAVTHG